MRWPWTLIAVPLMFACALPLGACSQSNDDPAAFDCAQWKNLSDTARSAALEKLALDNSFGSGADARLGVTIDTLCHGSPSGLLIPATRAVDIEKQYKGPSGSPRVTYAIWYQCDGRSSSFQDCKQNQTCDPGEVPEVIDEKARTYWCKMREPEQPKCDVAQYRTDQCAHLVDKSTEPGIQTEGP